MPQQCVKCGRELIPSKFAKPNGPQMYCPNKCKKEYSKKDGTTGVGAVSEWDCPKDQAPQAAPERAGAVFVGPSQGHQPSPPKTTNGRDDGMAWGNALNCATALAVAFIRVGICSDYDEAPAMAIGWAEKMYAERPGKD